jgi:hypothetical protein
MHLSAKLGAAAIAAMVLAAPPVWAAGNLYNVGIIGTVPTYEGGLKPLIYPGTGTISFFGTADTSCKIEVIITVADIPKNDESEWSGVSFSIPTSTLSGQTPATCPDYKYLGLATTWELGLEGVGEEAGDWAFEMSFTTPEDNNVLPAAGPGLLLATPLNSISSVNPLGFTANILVETSQPLTAQSE